MSPERWQRVKSLFHEVLDHPASEREEFLREACGGDGELFAAVAAMLKVDGTPDTLLDAGPEELSTLLPDESMPVEVGAQIGPYRVERKIGEGGMGVVCEAWDTRLDRAVALKFLPPHLTRDEAAKGRFFAEARAASALDHPNICTIYGVAESEGGQIYIAMAYYEGRTLTERLAGGALDAEEAVGIAVQVADALGAAHARGVVHRDVKPGNVLLTPDCTVKLLDFGIAKVQGTDRTRTGVALGTAAYMSPEQARGGTVDARTDVWSLGVLLYEMLTGERPIPGEPVASRLREALTTESHRGGERSRFAAGALVPIFERALARDPERRYPGGAEVGADLRALAHGGRPSAARTLFVSRRGLLVAGAAVVVLLAGFLLGPWASSGPAYASLAVLPLEDLSDDPAQAYFTDGMTEALISDLAQIQALHVISRASVMSYKDTRKPLEEIAEELGVDAVIEGSVFRNDGRVRITVQLVEAASDRNLWAQSYERELDDVFGLQREVARAIAQEVRATLTPGEEVRLADEEPRVDPAVLEAYLRGRYQWNQRTPDGLRQAIARFSEALDGDPTFAPAYAGLADSYHLLVWYGGVWPDEAFPRTRAAALRALELDSTLAEPWSALALTRWQYAGDHGGASDAFRRALELNPNYAPAHQNHGQFLSLTGRFSDGVAALERAQALDPLSPVIATDLASAYLFERRYAEAIRRYRRVLDVEPGFAVANVFLGIAHGVQGAHDEAVAALEAAVAAGGRNPLWVAALGRAYADAGREAEAREILAELGSMSNTRFVSPVALALLHLGLGDVEATFAALGEAVRVRDPYRIYLAQHPQFDAIRDDPRFARLTSGSIQPADDIAER